MILKNDIEKLILINEKYKTLVNYQNANLALFNLKNSNVLDNLVTFLFSHQYDPKEITKVIARIEKWYNGNLIDGKILAQDNIHRLKESRWNADLLNLIDKTIMNVLNKIFVKYIVDHNQELEIEVA